MPLQAIKFKPGVNRESTALANEGGWFESDKIRFRSGYPEKIGGWQLDSGRAAASLTPPEGAYWGVARALYNWVSLAGYDRLSVGTNSKYYIQSTAGGPLHDVTPIRETTAPGGATFTAETGSSVVTVTDSGHNSLAGDFVTFSGAVGLGGAITAGLLNAEHRVLAYISSTQYTIELAVPATAGDTGNGGPSTVAQYQLTGGSETFEVGIGWGAGGWGGDNTALAEPNTGWGEAASTATGLGAQLRTWSQSAYGEDLVFNARGGPIYYWKNNPNPNLFDRAVALGPGAPSPFDTDEDCPTVANYVLVSDASRFVLAFGVNDYGSTEQDPLLVRWSDQENYGRWSPAATNQAGSYRLSIGSQIVCAQQTRQEVLVFTDAAVYSMQYQGPPFVWGFQPLASNTSIMGPNAAATAHDITYWMGTDKFYVYNGRVQTLPCELRQYVFDDINLDQSYQIHAGLNDAFSEVWWFYCSAHSTTIDKYVVYNYLESCWYYGTLARTAWLDTSLRGVPTAAGYGGKIIYHEVGNDDGSVNPPVPIDAYVQSADFDIGDGNTFSFVWRIVPDLTFDGSTTGAPSADFSVRPRQYPGAVYGPANNPNVASRNDYGFRRTYAVQKFTPHVPVRIRGRQLAFRVGSTGLGVAWQLGTPRIDIRPDGKR
jgi:hypothetical protein